MLLVNHQQNMVHPSIPIIFCVMCTEKCGPLLPRLLSVYTVDRIAANKHHSCTYSNMFPPPLLLLTVKEGGGGGAHCFYNRFLVLQNMTITGLYHFLLHLHNISCASTRFMIVFTQFQVNIPTNGSALFHECNLLSRSLTNKQYSVPVYLLCLFCEYW